MIVHNCLQGSAEWCNLRAGCPTSSNFDKIMTATLDSKGRGRKSDSWYPYMNHLLAERILGRPIEGFQSEWMARGNEFEDRAVAAYEFSEGVDTETVGFCTTDDGLIGCSPDRFVIERAGGVSVRLRGLEAKCPGPAIHVAYLIASTGASKFYKQQLSGQCWVCEVPEVDIISYHPDMPEARFRFTPEAEYREQLEILVRAFSTELELKAMEFRDRGWIKDRPEGERVADPHNLFLTEDDLQSWAISQNAGGK